MKNQTSLHSFGVTKLQTISYHPQGNGAEEHMHDYIKNPYYWRHGKRQLAPSLGNICSLMCIGRTPHSLFWGFPWCPPFMNLLLHHLLTTLMKMLSLQFKHGDMQEWSHARLASRDECRNVCRGEGEIYRSLLWCNTTLSVCRGPKYHWSSVSPDPVPCAP